MAQNGTMDERTATPTPTNGPGEAEARREERRRRTGREREEEPQEAWWENPQLAMPLFPVDDPEVPVVLDRRKPPAFARLYKVAAGGRRVPLRTEEGSLAAISPDVTREELEDAYGAGRYFVELYPALAQDSPSGTVRPLAVRRLDFTGEELPWPGDGFVNSRSGRGGPAYYDEPPPRKNLLERITEAVDGSQTLSGIAGTVLPSILERFAAPREDPQVTLARLQAERDARAEAERERQEARRAEREAEARADAERAERRRQEREEDRRAEEREWERRREAAREDREAAREEWERKAEQRRQDREDEERAWQKRRAEEERAFQQKLEAERERREAERDRRDAEERAWQKRQLETSNAGGLAGAVAQVEKLGKAAEALGYSREGGAGMGEAIAAGLNGVGNLVQQKIAEDAATEREKIALERERLAAERGRTTTVRAEVRQLTAEPQPVQSLAPGEPAPAELPPSAEGPAAAEPAVSSEPSAPTETTAPPEAQPERNSNEPPPSPEV